ncbi:MAG TPA: DUF2877 domain-containing protein, partial [Elusimicrobiales bacterium]|nr:DUF2877 domain-containing protein [Elusimicrobiales bacterium]
QDFSSLAFFEKEYLRLAHPLSMAFVLQQARLGEFSAGFERAFVERAQDCCAKLRAGDFTEGAKGLNGLGFGFTPSGDDFICGLLLASHFLPRGAWREEVFAAVGSSNPVSRAAFESAYRGRACEAVKKLITDLAAGNVPDNSLKAALGLGSTSGADFLAGFLFVLKEMADDN